MTKEQTSFAPLYQQVKDHVLTRISERTWRAGDRISSENDLVRELGISRMTVNRALRELKSEGLLVRVAGVGSFVAEPKAHGHLVQIHVIADEVRQRGHEYSARVITLEKVSRDEAAGLELSAGKFVFHSLIVHLENGVPIQLEDRFVNPAVAPDYLSVDFTKKTASEYLLEVAPLQEAEHIVRAVMPDDTIRELLEIPPEEPCLLLLRRTWTAGVIASSTHLYHPASRYELGDRFKP